MGYMLRALIGRAEVLNVVAEQNSLVVVVPLKQDMFMVPIGDTLQEGLNTDNPRFEEYHPFYLLYALIKEYALDASTVGRIAYIEAEYFGGMGYQSAILWENGKAILGPFLAQNLPLREMLINRVLREMGVKVRDQMDEFDMLGLGLHRETDKWLNRR